MLCLDIFCRANAHWVMHCLNFITFCFRFPFHFHFNLLSLIWRHLLHDRGLICASAEVFPSASKYILTFSPKIYYCYHCYQYDNNYGDGKLPLANVVYWIIISCKSEKVTGFVDLSSVDYKLISINLLDGDC